MSEWQDIESAPKDGTPVLVWWQDDYHVARYAPLWAPENKRWLVYDAKWKGDGSIRMVSEIEPNDFQARAGLKGPTHWMPLPEPPTAGGGRRGTA